MAPLDWMDVLDATGPPPGRPLDPEADRLLAGLNPPQREAASHPGGPLLILAGAGSGKTRVITRRIAWLVQSGRAAPHEILAITFTNKAAREMRARVAALMPSAGTWIGTFHATCARVLRREIGVLGAYTPDFSIYDTADRNQLLKALTKDLGYDPARYRPAALGALISVRKNLAAMPSEVGDIEGLDDEVLRRVSAAYDGALARANALDFDDLLLKTREVFARFLGVRDTYAARFRHVLVDEYQDTNRVQYELVRHFASLHGNLDVCGDPDQSIYAWRGADIANILDFESDFPGARVVKLEQNYRSSGVILEAAQSVIRKNRQRKEKDLWTARDRGAPIGVLECGDENDEAEQIVTQIRALQAAGERLDEMAIFYRVNFMQRALERALRLSGLPYQIAGGVEFYQRREIKDLLAYLQVLANPGNDIAFGRIVNVPARGIGERSVQQLAQWAAARALPLSAAVRSQEARAQIRGRARVSAEALGQLLDRLEHAPRLPAAEALNQVIAAIEYFSWLTESADPEGPARAENVEELLANAATYDKENPDGLLRGFLQDVALVSEVDSVATAEDGATGQVTLMTVHAAKGLEFKVVFVAGLEEELFPHARALASDAEDGPGLEEERRLFYVALTRAQERLFLSWANTRMHFGETSSRQSSRFLDELPSGCIAAVEEDVDEETALGAFDGASAVAQLSEGDSVQHAHFGTGRVERLVGAGANARATVAFPGHGSKILLLQYAKLVRLGRGR